MKRNGLFYTISLAAAICALSFFSSQAHAQASPTAIGPGSYISLGVEGSGFQQDYGHHSVGGEGLYLDANLYRRIGIEIEARRLNYRTEEDIKENTYLGGIKISTHPRNLRPYAKLLAGRGEFDFPFHYATGSYFVFSPGAGLDWHLSNSRFAVRVVDFEYQFWPQFTYGALHPYGASAGISYDLFQSSGYPRGRRFHTK